MLALRALPVLLLFVLSAPASADQYEDQVLAQLSEASRVFRSAGYTALMGDGGTLDHQYYEDYSVELATGVTYAIVGVCDEDCYDLDLEMYDGYGDLIVKDDTDDDAPVVEFTVTQGGVFTLRVTMFHCEANPCYFGAGLYGY
jgi:hypothetical protein